MKLRGLTPDVIRRRKVYEEVAGRIEALIQAGHYVPGDQLPSERELMEAYGVGRTSVREAMFSLQKMGLLSISSGERARVIAPSARVLVGELSGAARHLLSQPGGPEHFQQARAFLEMALARHAARHATQAQIMSLAAALDANRRSVDDEAAFNRTDVAFHYVLAEIPQNPIFTALHEAIAQWLVEQCMVSGRVCGSARAACRAHQRIYDAVATRDAEAAELAMQEHLRQVERYYWRARNAR